MTKQLSLFTDAAPTRPAFKTQFLKWVGNKQRIAHQIVAHFPPSWNTYYEPFLGSGAVLGTLSPDRAVASDVLKPLVELWQTLQQHPRHVIEWYTTRWNEFQRDPDAYEHIRAAYNTSPNAADLLFLSRACYGGVIRFRKDGYISTRQGIHAPISPESFTQRVGLWHTRIQGTTFLHSDFEAVMQQAKAGDVIYCDPPYVQTQAILYGAQAFDAQRLFSIIADCKQRGVFVLLNLDGTKKSGRNHVSIEFPADLFEREVYLSLGRSMLRRFQLGGQTLEDELVTDRLLLTY